MNPLEVHLPTPHSTQETEPRHEENCFDVLRFVAALMVLVSHSFALVGMPEPTVFHYTLGGLGVNIFFVTSGYLICQSWQRDDSPARYLIRRGLRIFPALGVILLVTAFFIGPLMSSRAVDSYFSDSETYRYLGNFYFGGGRGLPGVFETNPYPKTVNGGLWTLKYEFFMYICLLGLGILGKWKKKLFPIGLAVAIIASASAAFWIALPQDQVSTALPGHAVLSKIRFGLSSTALRFPELACYFLLGTGFAYWRRSVTFRWTIFAALVIAWYVISAWSVSLFLILALVAYGSLTFGNARFSPLTRFGKRGDFSYGIYIYGFVVQQSMSHLLGPSTPWGLSLILSFAATLGLAFLSWNLIEAPALKAKDSLCALVSRGAPVKPV